MTRKCIIGFNGLHRSEVYLHITNIEWIELNLNSEIKTRFS